MGECKLFVAEARRDSRVAKIMRVLLCDTCHLRSQPNHLQAERSTVVELQIFDG